MKINTIIIQIIVNLIAIVVITLAIRHYMFYPNIDIDLGSWNVFYTSYGILYAIIIGFILIGALGRYEQLKLAVDSEINVIQNIRDFLIYFSDTSSKQHLELKISRSEQNIVLLNIRQSLFNYVKSVYEKEWLEMADKTEMTDPDSTQELKGIIVSVSKLESQDENDSIALTSIINSLSELTNHRTKRIYLSNEEIPPPIMKLLIFMSIFLVAGFLLMGVQNIWVHLIMIISFSTTIQLIINLLTDLNNPFSGIWNIDNKRYVALAEKIKTKMDKTLTH
jgi:hypothetical protein